MNDDYARDYKEVAGELLNELNTILSRLKADPYDQETAGQVKRVMYTVRNSAAMFGFKDIAPFARTVEDAYMVVLEGRHPVDEELIELTRAAGELIRGMLEKHSGALDEERKAEVIAGFERLMAGS